MQSNKKHLLTTENINPWQLESEDPVSCKDAPNDQRVGPKLDQEYSWKKCGFRYSLNY